MSGTVSAEINLAGWQTYEKRQSRIGNIRVHITHNKKQILWYEACLCDVCVCAFARVYTHSPTVPSYDVNCSVTKNHGQKCAKTPLQ